MILVTSPSYELDLGEHAFDTFKFAKAAAALTRDGIVEEREILRPSPARPEVLRLAHTEDWVQKTLHGRLTPRDLELLELPYSERLVTAHQTCAQGTLEACREARRTGLGLHAGGGSHHAFADHGEGFCLFNDIAIGIAGLLKEGLARAAVVDLDVHQGNGTASIFSREPRVYTFSMHQEDLYPEPKVPGSLDIGLPAGTGDAPYLAALKEALPRVLDGHRPELVVYQAGADPYEGDRLGGLRLTMRGLLERDLLVFGECLRRDIPVAVTLGGGYAGDPEDTVAIHAATLRAAVDTWRAHVQRT